MNEIIVLGKMMRYEVSGCVWNNYLLKPWWNYVYTNKEGWPDSVLFFFFAKKKHWVWCWLEIFILDFCRKPSLFQILIHSIFFNIFLDSLIAHPFFSFHLYDTLSILFSFILKGLHYMSENLIFSSMMNDSFISKYQTTRG